MSLLGSALGRGLAGAGAGLVDVGNRYLDNELQLQRAQAIADIQRTSALQLDTEMNSPARRELKRGEAGKDIEAETAARLKGKVAEATNPELLAADVTRTGQMTKATVGATAEANADAMKKFGTDPIYLQAMKNETAAKETASSRAAAAASAAHAELLRVQTGIAKKTSDLQDSLRTAIVTGDSGAEEQYRAELDVLNGKPGKREAAAQAIAEAQKAMAPALKIITDPGASPQAIEEARQTIAEQRKVVQHYAKKAGIDLAGTEFPPVPPAAVEYLKKNPGTAADFDAKFGPGAAAKIVPQGANAAPAKPASLFSQATPVDQSALSAGGAKQAMPTLEDAGWVWNGRTFKNQAAAYAARNAVLGIR